MSLEGKSGSELFEQLYRTHLRTVIAFFRRKGFSPEDAADLAQKTFLRVYKGLEGFRGETELEIWIRKIAKRVYINEIRDRHALKRAGVEEALPEDPPTGDPLLAGSALSSATKTVEADLLERERAAELRRAVEQLPRRRQEVLSLRLQGAKLKDIAKLLGVSIDTVKAHIFQAKKQLRGLLRGGEGERELESSEEVDHG